jgi:alcohol dehydrogenase
VRAIISTGYGPPEVLQPAEVESRAPRRNEISIRIRATAVTASEIVVRALRAPPRYSIPMRLIIGWKAPRQGILGMVLAGDVESAGRSVTRFKEGDSVFGMRQWGGKTYAEQVCWPAEKILALKPANLSYEEAAALPYGGLLAMHCLRKRMPTPGQRVLVYGASGAIGTAAVQLARHFGAVVAGVCSTTNLELVKSLGAESVIDYTREEFTARPERYDLIFDAAGRRKSAAAMRDAARALAPGGLCISIDDDLPRSKQEDLDLIKTLAESGALKPVIDRVYRLEEMAEAHRYVELGHKKGNVIVTMGARFA